MNKNQINPSEKAILYEMFASFFLQVPNKSKMEALPSILEEVSEILPMIDFKSLIEPIKELKDFKQEYYNHFFVPSNKTYIPPYESAVVGASIKEGSKNRRKYGSLWTKSSYHVSMCYESVGFNPWELEIEEGLRSSKVPDHIGFELAFMAYLSREEAAAYEEIALEDRTEEDIENANRWKRLQEQFLKEHLQKFVSSYYEIAKEKFNPFYLELINILNSYIKWELETK